MMKPMILPPNTSANTGGVNLTASTATGATALLTAAQAPKTVTLCATCNCRVLFGTSSVANPVADAETGETGCAFVLGAFQNLTRDINEASRYVNVLPEEDGQLSWYWE